MKILVIGAHFTPAVATIEQLKKFEQVNIVYVGRKTTLEGDKALSVESQVLPKLGVKFRSIVAGRIQREFSLYTIPSLLKIPIGFLQAFFIILSEKPDVILSFGGYVAAPLVFAGWLFSIPIIIHEQTLVSGLANKFSSLFADKIALSFEGTFTSEKVVVTGNPIRSKVINNPKGVKLTPGSHLDFRPSKGGTPKGGLSRILIMGGNQGSHILNLAVEECLDKLLKIAYLYHQTGSSKYQDFERLGQLGRLGKLGERYQVKKWIGKDYGRVLQQADLVVCRAGINTLSELAYLGKPALLIPIPGKEQRENAKYFEEAGLAQVLPQSKLSGETLITQVKLMLDNLDNLQEKAKAVKKVIIPDAAKRLTLETILLVKNRTS